MTARLVLPPDAPRDEWLAARREGITASEIAVLLGISPYDSPFNLYWKKLGEIGEDYDNDAMSLGRHLEPWIADRWAEAHPEFVVTPTGLWASKERPWQMATPDRYLLDRNSGERDGDALLEIKSSGTYDGWGEGGTDQIPAHYRAQVLWQLDTLGLGEAHVCCLFLATRQIRSYTVAYDVADVDLMREAARDFLNAVEAGDVPPIDHHPATTAALKALNPKVDEDAEVEVRTVLAANYLAACEQVTTAKKTKARLENELRAAMGSAKYAVRSDGTKVATRSTYTVAEHIRRESHVDKLIPARTPKDPT